VRDRPPVDYSDAQAEGGEGGGGQVIQEQFAGGCNAVLAEDVGGGLDDMSSGRRVKHTHLNTHL
jgi:hypothetical protein